MMNKALQQQQKDKAHQDVILSKIVDKHHNSTSQIWRQHAILLIHDVFVENLIDFMDDGGKPSSIDIKYWWRANQPVIRTLANFSCENRGNRKKMVGNLERIQSEIEYMADKEIEDLPQWILFEKFGSEIEHLCLDMEEDSANRRNNNIDSVSTGSCIDDILRNCPKLSRLDLSQTHLLNFNHDLPSEKNLLNGKLTVFRASICSPSPTFFNKFVFKVLSLGWIWYDFMCISQGWWNCSGQHNKHHRSYATYSIFHSYVGWWWIILSRSFGYILLESSYWKIQKPLTSLAVAQDWMNAPRKH
jgi:hypothetical protein